MNTTLEQFLPQPHPTKQIFSRHQVPAAAVARYLGFSTAYTCSLLNGFARVSPENDRKLRDFAELVQEEANWGL